MVAYRWTNGTVMVFGFDGQQIPELQGEATQERLEAIRQRSTPKTQWNGFGEDGPWEWP
jgi:hypothetical protein